MDKVAHTTVYPQNTLNLLSRDEILGLTSTGKDILQVFRDCALAILNTDSREDDAAKILEAFSDFDIKVLPQPRGLKLELFNAPAQAFVDGQLIRGIQEHLYSALRDIVYIDYKMRDSLQAWPSAHNDITSDVFRILRNARVVRPGMTPNLVVCWGGHSIPREEYMYSKEVGYQMGLRGLDIVTGCGIGAMKGPMKGATIGHAKQQNRRGRYIGISEPGIIASESPNAIVTELVIMPDIEKRLEAFMRLAHGIVVFPGGVGTLEEVLYLLSILMHPDNSHHIQVVMCGPESSRSYFEAVNRFIVTCLGEEAARHYSIIIGSPDEVAREMSEGISAVRIERTENHEAYYFNWNLNIAPVLQKPFIPTHASMAALRLDRSMPSHELANQLRAAFSGIVAGNVKAFGIAQVAQHGPYPICGDADIMAAMDQLLEMFVEQGRMKLGKGRQDYQPCYMLV